MEEGEVEDGVGIGEEGVGEDGIIKEEGKTEEGAEVEEVSGMEEQCGTMVGINPKLGGTVEEGVGDLGLISGGLGMGGGGVEGVGPMLDKQRSTILTAAT